MLRTLISIGLFLAAFGRAQAGTALIDVGDAPILNAQMTSGSVTVKTWSRPQIAIDTQGTVQWQHYTPNQVAAQIPAQFSTLAQNIETPQGPATLAPEVWVLPPLSPQPHDGMVLHGGGNTIITVPAGTALVAVRVGTGTVVFQDYHDGVFFSTVQTGAVVMRNVTGTGFAQVARGPIVVVNSSFDRFRGRTAAGNMLFENVNARQIAVTSVRGSIVYDNGSFQPGLARFESDYGNVALGIGSGGAQIGAHSDTGRVITNFNNVRNSNGTITATDANATLGGGGPTVTANSTHGSIILYDGHLADHPALTQRFPGVSRSINRQNFFILRSTAGASRRMLQQKLPQKRHI